MSAAATPLDGLLLRVSGVVQGVGFRPFVHRLAVGHHLHGFVRNVTGEVEIAVTGDAGDVARFVEALRTTAPVLARIDAVRTEALAPEWDPGGEFRVLESVHDAAGRQLVPPDVAVCAVCEAELYDPRNRRYGYPFITCTDCGPRHSVIEAMPYDRARTAMRAFTQCPACRREYHTLGDRRYHSETNSCSRCGPRLTFLRPATNERTSNDAIGAAARALRGGAVVAVRGIGGFHLAADATSESAVARLRARKRRDGKPLAVMMRHLDDVRAVARVSEAEAAWLAHPSRPIVVLERRADDARIAPGVADGLGTLGVMLPYAPLQLLLLDAVARPLVMTSGNRASEPLTASLSEATRDLGGIADAFLTHDREIVARTDDSVVRVAGRDTIVVRRARGFAPLPVPLPIAAPSPLLAVGAHLKNTFTLSIGADAFVSQHIGDLETPETADHWRRTVDAFRRFFDASPDVIVHDLHPGYLSTQLAEQLAEQLAGEGRRRVAVQHHHAHIAAVAAEHGVTEPVLGIALDGTGYGDDGRIWGAELLIADLRGYRRVAHLRYARLPGGERAVRAPWRSALGYLALEPDAAPLFAPAFEGVPTGERETARRQAEVGLNAPEASSMGRLFDAVAALLAVSRIVRFEGEAAMRLESFAGHRAGRVLPCGVDRAASGLRVIDPLPLLRALGAQRLAGEDVAQLAADFHESIAATLATVVADVAGETSLRVVALGGGVFQNARLLAALRSRLEAAGLRVLTAVRVPANDGGISYGQAAVGAAALASGGALVDRFAQLPPAFAPSP